jgi:hypothetical protein
MQVLKKIREWNKYKKRILRRDEAVQRFKPNVSIFKQLVVISRPSRLGQGSTRGGRGSGGLGHDEHGQKS